MRGTHTRPAFWKKLKANVKPRAVGDGIWVIWGANLTSALDVSGTGIDGVQCVCVCECAVTRVDTNWIRLFGVIIGFDARVLQEKLIRSCDDTFGMFACARPSGLTPAVVV